MSTGWQQLRLAAALREAGSPADESDNRMLEAAAAGRADLIVTGDKAMQELGSFRGIPIVSAAQFAAQLQQGHAEPPGPSGQTS